MSINFNKNSVFNLSPIQTSEVNKNVHGMLCSGEEIIIAFKTVRDQLIFTNKRIISVDIQGITGKRISFSSLPYKAVQFFVIQTPGIEIVPDAEIELVFANGTVATFEIKGKFDIMILNKLLSEKIL